MSTRFARINTAAAMFLRFALLIALLALPALSIPSLAGDRGTIIDGTVTHSSGAGLVIVAGLKRAR